MTRRLAALALAALAATTALAGPPAPAEYTITNLGVDDPADFGSQGFGASGDGVAVGRSLGSSGSAAFYFTQADGFTPLPIPAAKPYGVANGASSTGLIAGTAADTFFGSGAAPLLWDQGVLTELPIPAGLGVGRANDVNDAGVVVGSCGGGISETATYWIDGAVSTISATTTGGATMTTAFRVNNDNVCVGVGIDPMNAARNVPLMYDIDSAQLREITTLTGDNGGIAFAISDAGHVVGSSSFNQSSGRPFIWTEADGAVEIPLPADASTASARGVNSSGHVVGIGSSAFALPFLYDGTETRLVQDLLPSDTDWDLSMNTSSSALGIAEDGAIVGTGLLSGDTRAYLMTPAGNPADLDGDGAVGSGDLGILLAAWGSGDPAADLDGDGVVGSGDLGILLAAWGG